jgi:putative addiction module antidote
MRNFYSLASNRHPLSTHRFNIGSYNQCYNQLMKTKLRKIGNGLGVLLPKETIEHLRLQEGTTLTISETESGIELSPFDADFAAQVEAFRRTESRHRNSYRELAK